VNRKTTRKRPTLTREMREIYIALLQHARKNGLKGDHNYCMRLDLLPSEGEDDVERLKKMLSTLVSTLVEWRPSGETFMCCAGVMAGASLSRHLGTGDSLLTWNYSSVLVEQLRRDASDRSPGFNDDWVSIFSALDEVEVLENQK